MLRSFGLWLADVPLADPVERRIAPLFQLLLFGLIVALLISMPASILLGGDDQFIAGAFRFTGTLLLLSVIGSLLLLRRGYFKPAQWLVIAWLMIVTTAILRIVNLRESGHLLLLFTLPITTAGLLVGRGALALTAFISIAVVFVAGLNLDPPLTSPFIVFTLVTVALSILLEGVRVSLRQALISSMEHAAEVERAHQETYTQREYLQVTLGSIGDAVITTDVDGKISFMNTVAEALTGWRQNEVIGKPLETVFKIVNEDTRQPVENPIKRVLRDGVTVGLANHTVLIRKDGVETPIDDSGAPIREANSALLGAVLVFRDVTEQRAARAALEESERRFRIMADTAPVMIWVTDTTKGCIYFNQSWLDFTGETFEESYGFGWAEGVHPDDYDRVIETFTTAFDQRRKFTMDYRMRRYDGEYHWIVDNGVPRYDSSGAFLGYVGSCIDITDRKLSEERTRLLQQLTAALSESLTVQQVADTIMGEVMKGINSHVGTLYRLTEDRQQAELVNRQGLPPETAERYRMLPIDESGPMMEALRDGAPVWVENREDYAARYPELMRVVEQTESQAIACLPLMVESHPIGALMFSFREPMHFDPPTRAFMIALAQQCTQALERARLYEIEAEARRRAEEANQLKLNFLAMVSHELRTPLTSIKGFTSSLLAPDVSWSELEKQEFYRIMDEEADKLTDLVEQLLDVSRLHAGTLRIAPTIIRVSDILETAKPQLEALASAHALVLDVPPDLPPLRADRQRIAQVIANLVNNSAKFSPSASRIEVRVEKADDFLRFTVADEGEGIPLHERERIFEAFQQAERKTLQPGAGLGLAICKGLIEAHGGRIWIENHDEPGTRISFTLPVATSE